MLCKGQLQSCLYIQRKRHRNGIKFYKLCKLSAMILNLLISCSKIDTIWKELLNSTIWAIVEVAFRKIEEKNITGFLHSLAQSSIPLLLVLFSKIYHGAITFSRRCEFSTKSTKINDAIQPNCSHFYLL